MSYNHDLGEGLRYLRDHGRPAFARVTDTQKIVVSRDAMSHKIFGRDMEQLYRSLTFGVPLLLRETQNLLREP